MGWIGSSRMNYIFGLGLVTKQIHWDIAAFFFFSFWFRKNQYSYHFLDSREYSNKSHRKLLIMLMNTWFLHGRAFGHEWNWSLLCWKKRLAHRSKSNKYNSSFLGMHPADGCVKLNYNGSFSPSSSQANIGGLAQLEESGRRSSFTIANSKVGCQRVSRHRNLAACRWILNSFKVYLVYLDNWIQNLTKSRDWTSMIRNN